MKDFVKKHYHIVVFLSAVLAAVIVCILLTFKFKVFKFFLPLYFISFPLSLVPIIPFLWLDSKKVPAKMIFPVNLIISISGVFFSGLSEALLLSGWQQSIAFLIVLLGEIIANIVLCLICKNNDYNRNKKERIKITFIGMTACVPNIYAVALLISNVLYDMYYAPNLWV